DDVWATVGSANLNRRSWTHDSELTVAVLDHEVDERAPIEAGGAGEPAARFARELRLRLMREHLGRQDGDDADLVDLTEAADVLRQSAGALDHWYACGMVGPRPPGRLRQHRLAQAPAWKRALASPLYRTVFD